MFNKLINKLAQSIANATSTTGKVNATPEQLAQVKTLTIPANISGKLARVQAPTTDKPMTGKFTVGHLDLISSQYLKDAIAGLGAWSSLAKVFSEYERQMTSPRTVKDWTQYEQNKDAFHQWNAATSNEKQMDSDTVIIALDRMADVAIPKANPQADAIIARHSKKSVEELQAHRLAIAERKTIARREMITAIAADLWNFEQTDNEAELKGAQVVGKALQTLEWIANTWQGNPTAIATEILLIEADLKMLESIARQEDNHQGEGIAEVTETKTERHNYRNDPLHSKHNSLDSQQVTDWQAQEAAC